MKTIRGWHGLALAGCGLLLGAVTGCQTNVAGMTLPSGHYLQHPPQYFAPSPAFPLSRELATMEAQSAGGVGAPGGPVLPAPAPVAPPPAPGVVPVPGGAPAPVPPAGQLPPPVPAR